TFLAIALGQLLIGRASVESTAPFSIIVVLFAAALVLVSTTRAEPPQATVAEELPYGELLRTAPVAVAGAGLSGFITGAFYALVPAWMQGEGIERTTIGLFMVVTVMGGLAFQVPVGRLSDRFDRRIVLAGLGLGFAVAAIVAIRLPHTLLAILPVAVLLGGLMSTLYPICVRARTGPHALRQSPGSEQPAHSGERHRLRDRTAHRFQSQAAFRYRRRFQPHGCGRAYLTHPAGVPGPWPSSQFAGAWSQHRHHTWKDHSIFSHR